MKNVATLTRNQMLVLKLLQKNKTPMVAYDILESLNDQGFRAPLQVYRALTKLIEFGQVHKLQSINAFVACCHPDCKSQKVIAFMICNTCGEVNEIADHLMVKQIASAAKKANFYLQNSVVELRGNCVLCEAA